jgi:tetratricopeptide (TPR) repeat protein
MIIEIGCWLLVILQFAMIPGCYFFLFVVNRGGSFYFLGERTRMMKRIFISYCHEDEQWKERLVKHLKVLELEGYCSVWEDRQIEFGSDWLPEIEDALNRAQVAILLVSADFLISDFIRKEEIPRILKRRENEGLRVIPVIIKHCAWKQVRWLSRIQAFPRDGTPLNTLKECDIDARLTELAERLSRMMASPQPEDSHHRFKPLPPEFITISRLPATSAGFLGRRRELKRLDDAWKDDKIRVVCLVAWGGVGKTALVKEWLERMGEDNFRGAERVYAWSFYSQGTREDRQVSSDPFINDALIFFGDPDPTQGDQWEKGRRLAGLIRRYKTLLILDGLEPVQYPPGDRQDKRQGGLKDQSMQALLKELCGSQPGLCVVTSRLKVADLRHAENRSCLCLELSHLPPDTGVRLLKKLEIEGTDRELKEAVQEYDGHALALRLLAGFLKAVHKGDIRKRDLVPRLSADEEEGRHAERVMKAYETFLSGTPELNILYILGLFDRPAPPGAIDALCHLPIIEGLTDALPSPDDAKYKYALSHLRDLHLLAPPESHREDTLDCHPLVREYFAARLQHTHQKAWTEAHRRLYHYYKNLPEKEQPDTLEEMDSLFAAVAHGCRAGLHTKAWEEVYWDRIKRGNEHYSTSKLGAFGADLAALAGFFEKPWKEPSPNLSEHRQALVLNLAGFRLRALGRLREAAEPMAAGLAARIKQKNWKEAAKDAGNLSELWLTLGAVNRAVEYARQGVDYADRSGDGFQKYGKRTALADGLHQAGQAVEAEELFRQAEAMQKEEQPDYPFLYSPRGFKFCDLLLSRGRYKEVLDRAKQTLEWYSQASGASLLSFALDYLSLGRAHMQEALDGGSGDFERAAGFLDQAVTGLREAGAQEFITRGLLARAGLYREMGDYEKAWADLQEAQEIAERGDMKLHLTDYHLEAARLCGAEGKEKEARDHLERAKALIGETGYGRRLPEIKNSLQIAKQPLQNAKRRTMQKAK